MRCQSKSTLYIRIIVPLTNLKAYLGLVHVLLRQTNGIDWGPQSVCNLGDRHCRHTHSLCSAADLFIEGAQHQHTHATSAILTLFCVNSLEYLLSLTLLWPAGFEIE